MTEFIPVKLELVRPGPAHNQLLSPLTPYMALCGEGSPITFNIELEHQQMLSRLERLRYVSQDGPRFADVPERLREAALLEVGADVNRVLGDIKTLLAEVARARVSHSDDETSRARVRQLQQEGRERAVHLRLVLGGSELSLIPFEMAFAPQAFPGEGLEFTLQLALPVVATRETRSSRQLPVAWDRDLPPKVLFVSAAPQGLNVPTDAHILALRAAVEPWVKWPKGGLLAGDARMEQERLPLARERLRLLVNASLDDIRDACASERFTHVHILAHGDTYSAAGEQRFGVALCQTADRSLKDVVSGKRLAEALQAPALNGAWRSSPLVVTLATCDSGSQRSVLVPGGSIAHDLHVAGIPWVLASQFPLTVPGSVRMIEALYPLLLRGDDPRDALYEVRRLLHMQADRDHDWAALVTYATVPENFDDQIYGFFQSQIHRAIETQLGRADDLAGGQRQSDPARDRERETALERARTGLDLWQARLPKGAREQDKARRAECYGIHGSVYKRIALLGESTGANPAIVTGLLNDALAYYRKAMDEWALAEDKHHWAATQALSIAAVLGGPREPGTFVLARELAARDLARPAPGVRAWAHGTLAELEMLGAYHTGIADPETVKSVVAHCKAIVDLMGPDSFHVESTRRQFQRYVAAWRRPEWNAIAQAAVDALAVSAAHRP
jgi:hypothetical protein